nr:hypothetical protein [Tanacetum cinerariifolium]
MVEPKRVKVNAYIQGLTDNIKGEVTSSKPANINEAEKNVATGSNALPISTCYDCSEQGHTRNRCPKKVKQEEVGEVRGQAYAIKDAEPKGSDVVTGMFLLNNRYASVLFDSGFDRSFVDTRFSSMLNIDSVKIRASYEVELADGMDTFFGNKNKDAHEHVVRVLDIVSLFNIPGISHDVVMLRVFPITLTGDAKRWVDKLPPRTVDSWDLLKKAFIQSIGAKYRVGPPRYYTRMDNRPLVGEKRPILEELMNKQLEESTRRRTEMEEWVKKL